MDPFFGAPPYGMLPAMPMMPAAPPTAPAATPPAAAAKPSFMKSRKGKVVVGVSVIGVIVLIIVIVMATRKGGAYGTSTSTSAYSTSTSTGATGGTLTTYTGQSTPIATLPVDATDFKYYSTTLTVPADFREVAGQVAASYTLSNMNDTIAMDVYLRQDTETAPTNYIIMDHAQAKSGGVIKTREQAVAYQWTAGQTLKVYIAVYPTRLGGSATPAQFQYSLTFPYYRV